MTLYPVNEVFETLQGEARWTGTPSLFIRLQGCAVGCPWCDTKHTWAVDKANAVPLCQMLAKEKDTDTYAIASVDDLVGVACLSKARHVVITGGEPLDHNLAPLTIALLVKNKTVQIETSGTAPIGRIPLQTWVTVSPKVNMPGGKQVLVECLDRANEIKMPVGKMSDIEMLRAVLARRSSEGEPVVWLQPLSLSEKATALCIEQATMNGWRVSLQTHRFAGLR